MHLLTPGGRRVCSLAPFNQSKNDRFQALYAIRARKSPGLESQTNTVQMSPFSTPGRDPKFTGGFLPAKKHLAGTPISPRYGPLRLNRAVGLGAVRGSDRLTLTPLFRPPFSTVKCFKQSQKLFALGTCAKKFFSPDLNADFLHMQHILIRQVAYPILRHAKDRNRTRSPPQSTANLPEITPKIAILKIERIKRRATHAYARAAST